MTPKTPLSPFAKAMRRQHASSLVGTRTTERRNINQSPSLQLFTQQQRTGKPLKGGEWRSA